MEQTEVSSVSKSQGLADAVTLGEWMVTLLVAAIPSIPAFIL